jgi:hypothetical protein
MEGFIKKLLTTAMVLGAVMTLEAIQPAEAAVTQPVVSNTDQSQVTQTGFWWGGRHYFRGPLGGLHQGWRYPGWGFRVW